MPILIVFAIIVAVGTYVVMNGPSRTPAVATDGNPGHLANQSPSQSESQIADEIEQGNRLQVAGKLVEAKQFYELALKGIDQTPSSAMQSQSPRLRSAISAINTRLATRGSYAGKRRTESVFSDNGQMPAGIAGPPSQITTPAASNLPPATGAPTHEFVEPIQPEVKSVALNNETPNPAAHDMPAPPPAKPAVNQADTVRDGWDLITQGKRDEAKEIFGRLVAANPSNGQAQHGLGVCLYYVNGPKPATFVPIEKALTILQNDPIFINNAAAVYLDTLPMRSVKLLKDYMSDPSHPLLESMQNALGTCLGHSTDLDRRQQLFIDASKLYFDNDKRLEMSRGSGEKRWGMNWVPAGDATSKWAAIKSATTDFTEASGAADHANLATRHAHDMYQDLVGGMRLKSGTELSNSRQRWSDAVKNEKSATTRLEKVRTKLYEMEKPPFPPAVDILPPTTDAK